MRCPLCQQDMVLANITGSLARSVCARCNLHIVEQVGEIVSGQDLLDVLRQVVYAVRTKGGAI